MRKLVSLWIAILIIVGSLFGCSISTIAETPDSVDSATIGYCLPDTAAVDEYNRAIEYGFIPEELIEADPDETVVTWSQYCRMIHAMLLAIDEAAATNWQEEASLALSNSEPMVREQGCFALYHALEMNDLAVETENRSVCANVHLLEILDRLDDFSWNYIPFTGQDGNDEWPFEDIEPDVSFWNQMVRYCHGNISLVTGAPIFNNEVRINQPLTLRSAALSVVRSYEGDKTRAIPVLTEMNRRFQAEVSGYEEAAEVAEMRQRILDSETTIIKGNTYDPGKTYSGTAYYVSNNGDDANDGLTPEAPWATIDRVRQQGDLQRGDAVFFERGGFWRGNLVLWGKEGITVSSYGNGPKPIITSSPENGASEDKWELFSEGENGEKVWKFHENMTDCGVIVINDEITACKIVPLWTGSEWVNENGTFFNPETDLPYNLDFFSDVGELLKGTTEFIDYSDERPVIRGPLYLRCDEGNPGNMFDSIEFATISVDEENSIYFCNTVSLEAGSTLDNICIKYYPMAAADNINDGVVQNCEFAWGGGCMQFMQEGRVTGRMGDALCGAWGKDYIVSGNYFHDIFSSAMIIEGSVEHGDGGPTRNVTFADNLLVNTTGLNFLQERGGYENMHITGNIFLDNGKTWALEHSLHANIMWATEYWKFIRFQDNDPEVSTVFYNNCSITGNRFYYPMQYFLVGAIDQSRMPEFADNTYYLARNSMGFACWEVNPNGGGFEPVYIDNAESFLRDYMGDKTSVIVSP